jgi:hypothetical protein
VPPDHRAAPRVALKGLFTQGVPGPGVLEALGLIRGREVARDNEHGDRYAHEDGRDDEFTMDEGVL